MKNEPVQEEQPTCELHYLAFRAAFLMTFDCLLNEHLLEDNAADAQCGFLDYVPVMAATAPQVQLAMLLGTWKRLAAEPFAETLEICDRVVVYAASERLAAIARNEDPRPLQLAWNGPRRLLTTQDCWVYSKVRWMQAVSSEQGEQASQFSLLDTVLDGRWSEIGTLCEKTPQFDQLLDYLGQWRIDQGILVNIDGLLTSDEQDLLGTFFQEHPCLLS